jgi:hypothetical protein
VIPGWRQPCLAYLKAAAAAFRVGMEAQGNERLSQCIDALESGLNRGDLQPVSGQLLPTLEDLLSAQERGDMLFVADLLEYEIEALL